jgi:hypothetical protein
LEQEGKGQGGGADLVPTQKKAPGRWVGGCVGGCKKGRCGRERERERERER